MTFSPSKLWAACSATWRKKTRDNGPARLFSTGSSEPGFRVAGEAANGSAAVEMVRRLKPAILAGGGQGHHQDTKTPRKAWLRSGRGQRGDLLKDIAQPNRKEEPQSPNSRDSALPALADSLSLLYRAWQLRSLSSFSQSVVFLARIPRLRRSLGAHFEFVLSSFSKRDPVFSMT